LIITILQTAILTDIVGFDVIGGVPHQAIESIPYDNGCCKKKPGRNPRVRIGRHDSTVIIITPNILREMVVDRQEGMATARSGLTRTQRLVV